MECAQIALIESVEGLNIAIETPVPVAEKTKKKRPALKLDI